MRILLRSPSARSKFSPMKVLMLIEELYDALLEAGASEQKARLAARTVADLDTRVTEISSTLRLHSWMLTTILAMLIAIMFKVFK